MSTNLWVDTEHALSYLRDRDHIPHRVDALEVLCELLPERVDRALDLGTGDGSTLALVLSAHPGATGVGLDFGDEMLRQARERFAGTPHVDIARHDLSQPLPDAVADFDVVVSSFAIHHLDPPRQHALYQEVFDRLRADGVFVNAEHVASPSPALHAEFLELLGIPPDRDDPSNQLVPVDMHVRWLKGCGFVKVDCFWKWRELAVVAGTKPR